MALKSFFLSVSLIVTTSLFGALAPGQVVCAKWNSSWYLATLLEKSGEKWKVLYGDGDRGELTPAEIRELPWVPDLKAGDRVLAIYQNSAKFYNGVVLEVAGLGYKVKWDDGSSPSWTPATKILAE